MELLLTAILALVVPATTSEEITSYEWVTRIHQSVLDPSKYDVNVRPFVNASDTVDVSFGLAIINLIDVDDKKGSITANYWMRYLWRDARLKWDEGLYGGINQIRIPVGQIWQPDLMLSNRASSKSSLNNEEARAVVSSDGLVSLGTEATLTTMCSFDMTWFPYDKQTCLIKVKSRAYDGFKMDINFYEDLESLDLSDYIMHNEWVLTETGGRKKMMYYPCCVEPYPVLLFNLTLSRMSSYYTQMYVVPGVILALVTPFIFTLPVNKPHRYILGASLMITSAVITASFDGTVPMMFGTPIIGRWFTGLQTIVSVALILSAVISNLAEKSANGQQPPSLIRMLIAGGMARLLCVERGMLHMRSMDEDEGSVSKSASTEWFLVARVLDRLFFFVYCVIFLIMFILFSIK